MNLKNTIYYYTQPNNNNILIINTKMNIKSKYNLRNKNKNTENTNADKNKKYKSNDNNGSEDDENDDGDDDDDEDYETISSDDDEDDNDDDNNDNNDDDEDEDDDDARKTNGHDKMEEENRSALKEINEIKKRMKLRKEISKHFPSTYMDNRIKKDKKMEKVMMKKEDSDEDSEDDDNDDDKNNSRRYYSKKEIKETDKHRKCPKIPETDKPKIKDNGKEKTNEKKKNKNKENDKAKTNEKKKNKNKNDREDEDNDDDDNDDTETEDDDKEYNEPKKNKNIIILSIGEGNGEDDFEDYDEDYDEELGDYVEDENEVFESDDEKTFMKENYVEIKPPDDPTEKQNTNNKHNKNKSKNKKHSSEKTDKTDKKKNKRSSKYEETDEDENTEEETDKTKRKKQMAEDESKIENIDEEYIQLMEIKKHLVEKLNRNPHSKILRNALNECNISLKELMKSARSKNTKLYRQLVIGKQNKTTETEYFKNKLSNKEQIKIMEDLKEINRRIHIEKPYRLSVLQSNLPPNFKAIAIQKLNMLKTMECGDPEYHKIKNWVDTFMRIPFSVYKGLTVNRTDGLEKCNQFLENAKNKLDDCVYGLNDAKLQIMQLIGQWISNPSAMGTAIAIKGPMGTGKSSLVKDGISKILGREFAFIALGGAGDSSFLEGHSYTYEGSTWGKIVQILIDSKCMNPVIYFDELDKVSDTPRGQEIIGILTHLTDTTQNNQFHDKYFSEFDFDLSKCLFIFSYNDDNLVNPILKDRMYCIQTKGYDVKEKTIIAKNYLLPKIREQVCFAEDEVIIPDDIIQYIVNNQALTKNESGVRNLKRCLEIIYTKLNLFRLIKPDNNMFSKQIEIDVKFPITITKSHVDTLIKNEEKQNQSILAMYV